MMHPIFKEISPYYQPSEYPALLHQAQVWEKSKPLKGMRILDSTPIFRNTLTKYAALLCAGAELSVHVGSKMPCDPEIVKILPDYGVRVVPDGPCRESFDCISDCAGDHAEVPSRFGYVELTRTGGVAYQHAKQPVFWSDQSLIKEIETGLGTGDGFRRALAFLKLGDFRGQRVVLFGSGKVGTGVAMYVTSGGASLTVIEDLQRRPTAPYGARLIDLHDKPAIEAAVKEATLVVTATGVRHALEGKITPEVLLNTPALLVNLGVEDEYGDAIPAARVLNQKKPINFILSEPTLLRYIDPTMALQNEGILYLLTHRDLPSGLIQPPEPLVQGILSQVRDAGLITSELDLLFSAYTSNQPSK